MTRLAPRFSINKDGTATLAGIPHGDLVSILTAASLHHYDTEKNIKRRRDEELPEELAKYDGQPGMQEVVRRNHMHNEIWAARLRNTLDLADFSLRDRHHYKPTYHGKRVIELTAWELARRLEEAKEAQKFRRRLREMFAEIRAARAEALASDKG